MTQNKINLAENKLLTSANNSTESDIERVQSTMEKILDKNITLSTIELTKLFDGTKELAEHIKIIMTEYNKMLFQQTGVQQYSLTGNDLSTI